MPVYNKIATLKKYNAEKKAFEVFKKIHVAVNKIKGNEYFGLATELKSEDLVFRCRYSSIVEDIEFNTQHYQIEFRGITFNILDFDNFQYQNREVKLLARITSTRQWQKE